MTGSRIKKQTRKIAATAQDHRCQYSRGYKQKPRNTAIGTQRSFVLETNSLLNVTSADLTWNED